MLKCKNVVGINPYFIELDEKQSVDIDNMIDFRFAEFLYEREM